MWRRTVKIVRRFFVSNHLNVDCVNGRKSVSMKNILLLLLFVSSFSCKEKQLTPEELQPLVGKWRLSAVQQEGKDWEVVTQSGQHQFEIRYDGVILDSNGLPNCCSPKSLKVNGKLFPIEPKESLPNNPTCALVNCFACETWDIDLQGNTLVLSSCLGANRSRYEKL